MLYACVRMCVCVCVCACVCVCGWSAVKEDKLSEESTWWGTSPPGVITVRSRFWSSLRASRLQAMNFKLWKRGRQWTLPSLLLYAFFLFAM
jgi:hypothetical protein